MKYLTVILTTSELIIFILFGVQYPVAFGRERSWGRQGFVSRGTSVLTCLLFWFVFVGIRRESPVHCLLSVLSGGSHVHIAIHSTSCEETSRVEKIRWWHCRGWWWWAEWSGGEVVWESSEKLGQEAEENGTAGWAWEGNYHSELQYKMCDNTKVSAIVFKIVTAT